MTYDPGRRGSTRAPVLRSEWNEPLRAQRDPLAEDAGRVRANRDEHRHLPRQSWLGRFVATYGWRAYALPEDMSDLVPDVLRHRLVLSYEALSEGLSADQIVLRLMGKVTPPPKPLAHEPLAA